MAVALFHPVAIDRTTDERAEEMLFEHAPPMGVQRRLGLIKAGNLNIHRRALLFVLIGWVPLIVLAVVQGALLRRDDLASLLWQVGIHARYLVAVPLLVVAETACAPQLNEIVRNFPESGIVDERSGARFDDAIASTRKLLHAPGAEFVLIGAAYLVALTVALSYLPEQLPTWARSGGITPLYALAGWWHTLVSLPLLLILIFGWLWRLALWARLLWLISRLPLRLVASHPDHSAGLSFLGHSARAFAIVALALAAILAGRSASLVLSGAALPTKNLYVNLGFGLAIMALFVAPLVVFTPAIMSAWRRGTLRYGALADQVGLAFERKWLDSRTIDRDALDRPDFSATADLYAVVANVHAIRPIPIDLKDLATLATAMLVPFVPVVLLAVPLNEIWAHTKSLLF